MRILIVEDHDGIRMALQILLELEGYESVALDRGEDALNALKEQQFDLVLLDLTTNGISADEFMVRLGEMTTGAGKSRPPVCILSASSTIHQEAKRIGADYVIRKPFEHSDFLKTLKRIFNEHQDFSARAV